MSKKGRLFIISGPSGSGKTTLYKKLLRRKALRHRLVKVVSVTTRPARENERDGRDYLFIGKKEFLRRKRRGEFLESQNVFGSLYGTPRAAALGLLRKGKNTLLCIDVKGARAVKKIYPQAVSIFILPPSMETLNLRLKGRCTEGARAMCKRLMVAKKEIISAKNYDYRVVNDNLKSALKKLEGVILSNEAPTYGAKRT
jgi:guanylate kinase